VEVLSDFERYPQRITLRPPTRERVFVNEETHNQGHVGPFSCDNDLPIGASSNIHQYIPNPNVDGRVGASVGRVVSCHETVAFADCTMQ
jgi:hypothetical protein